MGRDRGGCRRRCRAIAIGISCTRCVAARRNDDVIDAIRVARAGVAVAQRDGDALDWRACLRRRDRAGDGAVSSGRRDARRELVRRDARRPIEGAVGLQVFVCVVEGALIDRVERHRGVVAPTISRAGCLHAKAGLHSCLGAHRACGVGRETPSHVDAGLHGGARFAVAERDVLVLIHRDRGHPAIAGIWIEGA